MVSRYARQSSALSQPLLSAVNPGFDHYIRRYGTKLGKADGWPGSSAVGMGALTLGQVPTWYLRRVPCDAVAMGEVGSHGMSQYLAACRRVRRPNSVIICRY